MIPFIVSACAIMAGAFLQGAIGFGFALVAVPPMMMVMDAKVVVPTLMIVSLFNTSWVAVQSRRDVTPRLVLPLVIGALFGVPVGVYILTLPALEGPLFKALVGVLMVLLATVMYSGWQRPVKNQGMALYPVGFVSGVLNGSISILGPPVVLFLANQETPKHLFRANLVTYFTIVNLFSLAYFGVMGLLTRDIFVSCATFLPFLVLATALGSRISDRISNELFRRITLACVAIGGGVLLIRNGLDLM